MKAAFGAEVIGLGYERMSTKLLVPLGGRRAVDPVNARPWLAEITGPDPRYGYARKFLPSKTDYQAASSTGNRGVWFWWTLESGRVYQTRYRTSWAGGYQRRFIAVADDGNIIDLTEEEVRTWLSEVSVSTS